MYIISKCVCVCVCVCVSVSVSTHKHNQGFSFKIVGCLYFKRFIFNNMYNNLINVTKTVTKILILSHTDYDQSLDCREYKDTW